MPCGKLVKHAEHFELLVQEEGELQKGMGFDLHETIVPRMPGCLASHPPNSLFLDVMSAEIRPRPNTEESAIIC